MINRKLFILLFIFLWTGNLTYAQCPGCVIDDTCPTQLPEGGLCPSTIPDGTVGVPYEESITFYIPNQLVVQGFDVTILNITVAQLSGIPFDLAWECNNQAAGCFYDVQAGDNVGCVKICGTPIAAPGVYTIDILVNALVNVPGIGTFTQPQEYSVDVNLLPGTGSTTFNYTGAPNCQDGYEADLCAIIDAPAPDITTYSWDLGNGTTSTEQCPPTQVYAAPGTYNVSLETQILGYKLDRICTTSIASESWCGDVEEPNVFSCSGEPDIFYELFDANGVQVAGGSNTEIANTFAGCWNLNVELTNPPYNLKIYDYDSVSANDLLCNTSFTPTGTNMTFTGAAENGNLTSGTLTLSTYVKETFVDSTTIGAFNTPIVLDVETFDVSFPGGSNGFIDLTVTGGAEPYTYFWGADGTTEDLANIPAGNYAVQVTDAYGCAATATATIFEPQLQACSTLTLATTKVDVSTAGGSDGSINLTVTGGNPPYSYFWGNGSTTQDISNLPSGDYAVQVTDDAGCTATTMVTIEDPALPCSTLQLTAVTTDASTFGGSDGSIDLTVTGGNPTFTYDWGLEGSTEDISGLTAGSYSIRVTDIIGCTASAVFTIGEPSGCQDIENVASTIVGGFHEVTAVISVLSKEILTSNAVVDYHAGESVTLEPGFTCERGTELDVYIQSCLDDNNVTQEENQEEEEE